MCFEWIWDITLPPPFWRLYPLHRPASCDSGGLPLFSNQKQVIFYQNSLEAVIYCCRLVRAKVTSLSPTKPLIGVDWSASLRGSFRSIIPFLISLTLPFYYSVYIFLRNFTQEFGNFTLTLFGVSLVSPSWLKHSMMPPRVCVCVYVWLSVLVMGFCLKVSGVGVFCFFYQFPL